MEKITDKEKEFYQRTSMYTNYGTYKVYFQSLPDDLKELTKLVNAQYIHRVTLRTSCLEHTKISKKYPWYKYRLHDDVLLTSPAMTAELFRLDGRGFVKGREIKNQIIITCRYASVLLASILKAKGYTARVRSGFATYFHEAPYPDHWIVQYYKEEEARWVNIDADEVDSDLVETYDNTDISNDIFIFAADAWLDVRSGKRKLEDFKHGSRVVDLAMLARSVFFDFHALMNDEISYLFFPTYMDEDREFYQFTPDDLKGIDDLALLLKDPDKNFDEIRYLFREDKKLRAINTPLMSDKDHLE